MYQICGTIIPNNWVKNNIYWVFCPILTYYSTVNLRSKTEKIEIIERIKTAFTDGGLTAYKAASETSLVDEGITNILKGKTKNPRNATVDILIEWLYKLGYSKKWLEKGEGTIKLDIDESASIFDHKIELFNRLGKPVTDDEFAVYFRQQQDRLLNNAIIKMIISEKVKDGIIEYYENDRKKSR